MRHESASWSRSAASSRSTRGIGHPRVVVIRPERLLQRPCDALGLGAHVGEAVACDLEHVAHPLGRDPHVVELANILGIEHGGAKL